MTDTKRVLWNLGKFLTNTVKNSCRKVKQRLVLVKRKIINTNYFYLVLILLIMISGYFLYMLTNTSGSQLIWMLSALITGFLLFSLQKARIASGKKDSIKGIWPSVIIIIIIVLVSAYFFKKPGILLIMPLYLVNAYQDFEIKNSGMQIKKSSITTLALMGIFTMVVAPYAVGLLEMKSNILVSFYAASIAVYTMILTIVGTFLGIGGSNKLTAMRKDNESSCNPVEQDKGKPVFIFNEALIGLIRMCIVFILVTLVAFLTGMYTSDSPNPPNLLASPLGFDSMVKFYPIIMLGIVAVSFPVVFSYMYSLIKNRLIYGKGDSE